MLSAAAAPATASAVGAGIAASTAAEEDYDKDDDPKAAVAAISGITEHVIASFFRFHHILCWGHIGCYSILGRFAAANFPSVIEAAIYGIK